MMFRRHGTNQPKAKSHVLGSKQASSKILRSLDVPASNVKTTASSSVGLQQFVPRFVKDDKRVLKFDSFFLEAVNESEVESFRVRKCVLYYYLEDDSIQIVEPKTENSGLTQGNFIKRHRIPKPEESTINDGNLSFYTFNDLNAKTNITCYGRTFRIIGMDAYTNQFLVENGIEVAPYEDLPEDSYMTKASAALKMRAGSLTDEPVNFGKKQNSMKVFMEASLGKFTRPSDHLKRFLDHDRHVLRWFGVWDDSSRLYGMKHNYVVHYFLADNTVEIREELGRNSGFDPFPKLLNRTRLEKKPCLQSPHATDDVPSSEVIDTEYYHWSDLLIGAKINVYGRELLVLDVDESTREWFTQHDVTLATPIVLPSNETKLLSNTPPPHNGIGSEEDSLASCFSLCPKPTKISIEKLINKDRLIFSAKLDTLKPEDVGRNFVITFFVADNNIGIMEPPVRNSGIVGGKFLEKGKHKNPEGNPFGKADFYIGSKLAIGGNTFVLNGTDEYTVKFMEQHCEQYPKSSMPHILAKLHASMTPHADRIRAASADQTLRVDFESLKSFLLMFDTSVVDHEVNTILRANGAGFGDSISLSNLCSKVLATSSPPNVTNVSAMKTIAKKILKDQNFLLQRFRLQDAKLTGEIGLEGFTTALEKQGVSEMDRQLLLAYFASSGGASNFINYANCIARLKELSMES